MFSSNASKGRFSDLIKKKLTPSHMTRTYRSDWLASSSPDSFSHSALLRLTRRALIFILPPVLVLLPRTFIERGEEEAIHILIHHGPLSYSLGWYACLAPPPPILLLSASLLYRQWAWVS